MWRAAQTVVLVALAACASASPGRGGRNDGGTRDLGGTRRDLAVAGSADLAVGARDLARPGAVDAEVPEDAAEPPDDLIMARADLRVPPPAPDLRAPPPPPDLTAPPPPADLTAPPPPPDLASPPPSCTPQTQPCDVVCQNCGAGQKCGISQSRPACAADGTVGEGQVCGAGAVDDCAAGTVCVTQQTIPSNVATCRHFCRSDADCRNGGTCSLTLTGSGLMVCSDPIISCDPVSQSGCGGGGCYVVTRDGRTGCHSTGPGEQFDTCRTDYDCQAGHVCAGPSVGCLQLCHDLFDCEDPFFFDCFDVSGWTPTGQGGVGVCDFSF